MTTAPSIYATPAELAELRRRLDDQDWFARCFANLRRPADELLRRGIELPREKGFVFYETCPADNTPLLQDPFNARDHPCPKCGRNYTDEPYYRAWVTFYQMYVAHRTVEMGIAYHLTGDDAYAAAIREVLLDYARCYQDYPLAGYILGPTRLFQSTYIESLWLAGLAAGADFVRETISAAAWRLICEELFLPSAAIIRSFDEGDNNRQAMNNVAIGFAGLICDEPSLVQHAIHGPHGWVHHLRTSILADGMWYEGDNYHFASLPAMINLAEAMSRHGLDLWQHEAGGRRLKMMFDAPLADLYPDLTMPARKDSRYGSPIGQRWHMGLYEVAYRRYAEPAYARLLQMNYAHPPATADCIRNVAGLIDVLPSEPANRERLDWRGFLNAAPSLAGPADLPMVDSAHLAGTGLAVLRADTGRTYASLDYGHYGGGHGHPDRLQLNFYARGRRWLTDWGTGNYLFDHLRWYRSTVGHNTVVVDGQDQQPADGRLLHFAGSASHPHVVAEATNVYDGVHCRRAAVLLSADLLLDLFSVDTDQPRVLDWVIHPYAEPGIRFAGEVGPPTAAEITGEHYEWLTDIHWRAANGPWVAELRAAEDVLAVHGGAESGTVIFTAEAYGAPQEIPALFPVLIVRRETAVTTFATLFEHRAGGTPLVTAFRRQGSGHYHVACRDGRLIDCRWGAGDAVPEISSSD